MPPVAISIEVIALILGILGWRSFVGKAVAILSSGILLIGLGEFVFAPMIRMQHDFGGWPSLQRLRSPGTEQSRQAVSGAGDWGMGGPSGPVESTTSPEVLRAKLEYAEQRFKVIEGQYNTGAAPINDYLAAKRDRDAAAADMKGDKQAAARIRLEYAEQILKFIKAQYEAGAATFEQYLAAKRDRDVAAADVKGDKQGIAQANLDYADKLLNVIEAQRNSGIATEEEYRKAQFARKQAAMELQALEQYERSKLPYPAVTPRSTERGSSAQVDPLKSPRASDMRTIVLAALDYATEHPEWPKTLDELKPKYLDAGKINLGQFVYYPLSAESLKKNPQEVVVLAEKEPAFAGGRLVGFADGYIEFIQDPERLKRLIPVETKSPPVK
jgi:hypothetical protein